MGGGGEVGNGGLSLRRKSKMLEIMKNDTKKHLPEDMYFAMSNVIKLHKPTFEKSKQFSMEWIFSEKSFGCHKTYPDIELLKELDILFPKDVDLHYNQFLISSCFNTQYQNKS
jgi:hypothetical protein